MVMVAGNLTGMVFKDPAFFSGKNIPDVCAFAVFCYSTFNLIGTGSCSPYKIRREFYFTRRIIGDFSYRGFISFLF